MSPKSSKPGGMLLAVVVVRREPELAGVEDVKSPKSPKPADALELVGAGAA